MKYFMFFALVFLLLGHVQAADKKTASSTDTFSTLHTKVEKTVDGAKFREPVSGGDGGVQGPGY